MGFFLGCGRDWAPVGPTGGWWETVCVWVHVWCVCVCMRRPVAELTDELMTSFLGKKKNAIVIARAVAGKLIKRPNGDYWLETRSWEREMKWWLRFFFDFGKRGTFRNRGFHPGVFLTSAVRPLVPAVAAVRVAIAQLAYVDAHVRLQAAVLVDGTLIHPAVRTWKQTQKQDGEGQMSVLWWEDEHQICTHIKAEQLFCLSIFFTDKQKWYYNKQSRFYRPG